MRVYSYNALWYCHWWPRLSVRRTSLVDSSHLFTLVVSYLDTVPVSCSQQGGGGRFPFQKRLINSSCSRADANCIACIPLDLISEANRGILAIGQPRFSIIIAQVCVAALNTAHTIVSRDRTMPILYLKHFHLIPLSCF